MFHEITYQSVPRAFFRIAGLCHLPCCSPNQPCFYRPQAHVLLVRSLQSVNTSFKNKLTSTDQTQETGEVSMGREKIKGAEAANWYEHNDDNKKETKKRNPSVSQHS